MPTHFAMLFKAELESAIASESGPSVDIAHLRQIRCELSLHFA